MKATRSGIMGVGLIVSAVPLALADAPPSGPSRGIRLRTSADVPCEHCGPGPMWMASCTGDEADVLVTSRAEIAIYMPGDTNCSSPTPANFILSGSVTIQRTWINPTQIDTEITEMELTGGGATVLVGPGPGNGITQQSLGIIVEEPADNMLAATTFEVFFEADLPGYDRVWNHIPFQIESVIDCVPPDAEYIHPEDQCIALYDDPDLGEGSIVAYLGKAKHITVIPTLSEWTAIGMTLLLLTAGTLVFFRKRGRAAVAG